MSPQKTIIGLKLDLAKKWRLYRLIVRVKGTASLVAVSWGKACNQYALLTSVVRTDEPASWYLLFHNRRCKVFLFLGKD